MNWGTSRGSFFDVSGTFAVIALIFSIVAVVLAFIFIVPEKKREKLNGFGRFLHDTFNFKYLIVEKILQTMYIFATVYTMILGFLMLFYVNDYTDTWYGGYGLLVMIFGPIVIRLVYELLMMVILLVKNVISINNKLKSQGDNGEKKDPFAAPDVSNIKTMFQAQPKAEVAQSGVCCPNCGTPVNEGTFCPQCGVQVKS